MTSMSTLFLLSVLLPSSVLSLGTDRSPGLEYGDIGHKIIEEADEDGELEISVKVSVRNRSDEETHVNVKLRALDSEDFEVFEMRLSGKLPARGTRVLTDTDYVSEKIYKSIARWEVEE